MSDNTKRRTKALHRRLDALRANYESMVKPHTPQEKRRRTLTARRYADACRILAVHLSRHAEDYV